MNDAGLEQRSVDQLPFSGLLAVNEGGNNSQSSQNTRSNICHGGPYLNWGSARTLTCYAHQATHSLRNEIKASLVGIRPSLPESGERTVDETRVFGLELDVAQS